MPRPQLDRAIWQQLNERRRSPSESTQDVIERLLEDDDEPPEDRAVSAGVATGEDS